MVRMEERYLLKTLVCEKFISVVVLSCYWFLFFQVTKTESSLICHLKLNIWFVECAGSWATSPEIQVTLLGRFNLWGQTMQNRLSLLWMKPTKGCKHTFGCIKGLNYKWQLVWRNLLNILTLLKWLLNFMATRPYWVTRRLPYRLKSGGKETRSLSWSHICTGYFWSPQVHSFKPIFILTGTREWVYAFSLNCFLQLTWNFKIFTTIYHKNCKLSDFGPK